jgi:hypothetical protein
MDATSPVLMWGALVVGGSSALAWVYFWIRVGSYVAGINAAKDRAEAAEKRANERGDAADRRANEAHEKVALLNAAFGLFQVQVAEKYASQQTIREVEDRLSRGIEQLRQSNSESSRTMHGRLDDILKAVARLQRDSE